MKLEGRIFEPVPANMRDFWAHCGYNLLAQDPAGQLVVTDEFLRALMGRPELAPIDGSCADELALYRLLLEQPRAEVDARQLAAVRDDDARENYSIWLRFRRRLLAEPTLEGSYLALFQGEGVDVPPLFVHQLTQVLLRHVLGGEATALQARSAEMLFRTQRIALQDDGRVMAADDETVQRQALSPPFGALGELLKQAGAPLRSAELDVLQDGKSDMYWERDGNHDLVICLNHGQPALEALCRVLERWVRHFLKTQVRLAVAREIDDELWVWHVGLDAQSSAVLNDLYRGHDVTADRLASMLCLFSLEFEEPQRVRAECAGRPVYLAMAMDGQRRLKLKPQNLLVNLPLARLG